MCSNLKMKGKYKGKYHKVPYHKTDSIYNRLNGLRVRWRSSIAVRVVLTFLKVFLTVFCFFLKKLRNFMPIM